MNDKLIELAKEKFISDWGVKGMPADKQRLAQAAFEAGLQATTPMPSKQELANNGYVYVIDVEKLLCEKLGRNWSATGISIDSLADELLTKSNQAITPKSLSVVLK